MIDLKEIKVFGDPRFLIKMFMISKKTAKVKMLDLPENYNLVSSRALSFCITEQYIDTYYFKAGDESISKNWLKEFFRRRDLEFTEESNDYFKLRLIQRNSNSPVHLESIIFDMVKTYYIFIYQERKAAAISGSSGGGGIMPRPF